MVGSSGVGDGVGVDWHAFLHLPYRCQIGSLLTIPAVVVVVGVGVFLGGEVAFVGEGVVAVVDGVVVVVDGVVVVVVVLGVVVGVSLVVVGVVVVGVAGGVVVEVAGGVVAVVEVGEVGESGTAWLEWWFADATISCQSIAIGFSGVAEAKFCA